ncbi:MAG: hypothetical protein ACFFF4_18875 [Candidatus Thorarchaeota archaeon]
MVESDVKAVDDQRPRIFRTLLLFLFALIGPILVGYQYLEWSPSSDSHMTWFIATGIGSIENSDWIGSSWVLRTFFSSRSMDPVAVLAFFLIFLFPRLLFATATIMHESGRLGKPYVVAAMVPVIAVAAWTILQLMTASIILGQPPGVFISIAAPNIDSRFFLPTPIMLIMIMAPL